MDEPLSLCKWKGKAGLVHVLTLPLLKYGGMGSEEEEGGGRREGGRCTYTHVHVWIGIKRGCNGANEMRV